MGKMIFVCVLFLISCRVYSHNLLIDSRIDYVDYKKDKSSTFAPKYKGFEATDLRIDYKGKYQENYKYRLRYNYRKSSSNDAFDKLSPAIEYAYIEKDVLDNISVRIGKVAVLNGGIEYDELSTEVYKYSLVGDSLPVFEVGATLAMNFHKQTIKIQAINSNKSVDSLGNKSQNGLGYGFVWYGNLMNSIYKPIWGYSIFPQGNGAGRVGYIAFGNKLALGNLLLDFDYLISNASVTDVKNTSIVSKVKYMFDNINIHFKYFLDESKVNSLKQFDSFGFELGLEYYPERSENIRYHLVYTGGEKTGSVANIADTKERKIFLGTKFNIAVF